MSAEAPGRGGRRAVRAVRLAGLAFAAAATVGFAAAVTGGHSHGRLRIVDGAGNQALTTSAAANVLAAGPFEFEMTGAGDATHDFLLVPRGGAEEAGVVPTRFSTGERAAALSIEPGDYVVVCASPGHGNLRYEIRVE